MHTLCGIRSASFAYGITRFLLLAGLSPVAGAQSVRAEVLARNLEHPWALAFIDGGRMLVSERPGRLRLVVRFNNIVTK